MLLKKILIASGLQNHIEEEKSIIKRAGYKILTAHSGEEALEIHKSEKADIIIADLDMPDISGDRLCSFIKNDTKSRGTAVILICADSKSDILRCSNSGADFYLTEPIIASVLQKKIRELLNIEKRKSLRIPLKVSIVGSYGYSTFFCSAIDISATGLLIETERILHKGKSLSCLLSLPGSRQVTLHGKIVRVKHKSPEIYQYGINYYVSTPDTKHAIEFFIKSRSTR